MSVIEVLGMIGAGKTTLTLEMIRLLEERGYTVLSRVDAVRTVMDRTTVGALGRALLRSPGRREQFLAVIYRFAMRPAFIGLFVARNPTLVRSVVGSDALRHLSRPHRRAISRLLYRTGALVTFISPRLKYDEVLILEEGMHHRAVNLFSWDPDGVDRGRVIQYTQAVPAPDLVVSIEAPAAVCAARARSRGLPGRLESQSVIGSDRFLANAVEVVDLVRGTLDGGTHPMLRIWNGGELEDAVAGLRAGLESHIEPVPTP